MIASRYLSSTPPNYASAIDILSSGALLLLQASTERTNENEGNNEASAGSGADLCIYLLDVYNKSETKLDAESRGRILRLLRAFPKGEPTRKRFVSEAVA